MWKILIFPDVIKNNISGKLSVDISVSKPVLQQQFSAFLDVEGQIAYSCCF